MYWEIIELANGEVALRRADSNDDPLLVIRFSDEAKERLKEQRLDVARAMISAGVQVATEIESSEDDVETEDHPSIVH
jgi:hypothetical protein